MWTTTFHRFINRAAFLAACDAAGWPVVAGEPQLAHGVALDVIGALIGPASVGEGGMPVAGDVIDPRFHVNLAWHAQDMHPAFSASQVAPAAPARIFDIAAPGVVPPAVPTVVAAWKAKVWLMGAGMLEAAQAAADAGGPVARLAWDAASHWERTSPLVQALASGVGLSAEQIDAAFIAADSIQG
jgi:hypothetical protein